MHFVIHRFANKLFYTSFSVFLLFPGKPFLQTKDALFRYQLGYFDTGIHVEMQFVPVDPDSTKFTYGDLAFGGQKDIFNGLQHIKTEGQATVRIDSNSRVVVLYYHGTDQLGLRYDVLDTRTEYTTRSQLFRPMITKDYFFVHGLNLFLTPALRTKNTTARVAIQWKQPPPFKMFYTFAPDNDGLNPVETTQDSISHRFMTGAVDLNVKKFSSESGDNYLVLRSKGMPDSIAKEIEDFYLGYNTTMRQFWNDRRKIKYSLVLQPYIKVDHSMSGISFGNGFIGKYNKPDSVVKGERMFTTAHEIGHYYLSDLEADTGINSEGQWFDEGFNDYLTFFNLVRSNNMSAGEFDTGFNDIFKSLYSSTIKNTPNNKIFENFWILGDYAKLPYWRGCVFAFYLDNRIAVATGNKNSIRDLMLDLKELVKGKDKKMFSNDEFIQAATKYLPKEDFKNAFNEYIIKGTSIAFNDQILLPFFHIEMKAGVPVLTITDEKEFLTYYQAK